MITVDTLRLIANSLALLLLTHIAAKTSGSYETLDLGRIDALKPEIARPQVRQLSFKHLSDLVHVRFRVATNRTAVTESKLNVYDGVPELV